MNSFGTELKIYNISNSLTNHVVVNYKNTKLSFLIDTGADISICKLNLINEDEKIIDETITLTGITKEKVASNGIANLKFDIYGKQLNNNFHLVNSDFPI